jgi:chromate transporter
MDWSIHCSILSFFVWECRLDDLRSRIPAPSPVSTLQEVMESNSISAARMFWIFLKMGATSFGGPIAHLALFRREFVHKRKWISEAEYAELVALCQSLPGPSSSQVGLLIARSRSGVAGCLAAFLGFTLPGATLLSLAASWLNGPQAPWIGGLRVFAVAIVCQAVWSMARSLTPDPRRKGIGLAAMAICMAVGGGAGQILAIAMGGGVGQILCREPPGTGTGRVARSTTIWVLAPLAVYAALLALVLFVPMDGAPPLVRLCAAMYRAGALVFGGGHVVLPLLTSEVVGRLGMSTQQFFSGYGLVQGMPGPIFNIAAWVGASMTGIVGSVCATLAIFLPGILVALGARPIWSDLRALPRFQRGVAGTNAAVVGVLAAAFVQVVVPEGIHSLADLGLATIGLFLMATLSWPPWLVASICAGAAVGIKLAGF